MRHLNILFLDDEVETHFVFENSFEDHRTFCTVDAKQAFEIIQKEKIDCVVTDLDLRLSEHAKSFDLMVNGSHFAGQARAFLGKYTPIFLASGHFRAPEIASQLIQAGVINDFIPKPYGMTEIRKVVFDGVELLKERYLKDTANVCTIPRKQLDAVKARLANLTKIVDSEVDAISADLPV
ncbi:hypothetical protein COB52_00455 [Candidatus Kaiserbacteria bacterium]|nr:MAG: hypothetical protein COB52_00455 [Candidatus Kaiserbacteria bacterium]